MRQPPCRLRALPSLLMLAAACQLNRPLNPGPDTGGERRRVLFFLGDGMGIPVLTAARIYAVGEAGSLTIDTLPETAYVRTYSNDAQVIDSAASMSAYMTGVKPNNNVVSMTADTLPGGGAEGNGAPATTLFELAEAAGWSTGVVTTTRVTHATPAACFAHAHDRDLEDEIARQLAVGGAGANPRLGDGLEVILGGGERHFLPLGQGVGRRLDGRDLVAELVAQGYAVARGRAELLSLPPGTTRALGLFAPSHMSYELDRDRQAEPSLEEMAVAAVDLLDRSGKSYVLMVEGGRIDQALHDTNAKRALVDTVAFDQALAAVMGRVQRDDPQLARTLIVATADHDHTLVLNGYARRTGPTTETQPGILGLVRNYTTGALDLDADGRPYTILGFGNGERRVSGSRAAVPPLTESETAADDYRQEAAIRVGVSAETHGGTDVTLAAVGAGAELFHGFLDNTEVFSLLRQAAGL
jgi:alkaline phosphatase